MTRKTKSNHPIDTVHRAFRNPAQLDECINQEIRSRAKMGIRVTRTQIIVNALAEYFNLWKFKMVPQAKAINNDKKKRA